LGKSTVFANKQGLTNANSGAVSQSGPDVCLTQVGNAVVPIPYTNVARSSTLEKGSKTVKVKGAMAAIDGCCYSSSTGDQAGSKKGVISGTVGGKAEFINYSSDVKIEGKGVCRNMDKMTHNNGNAIGTNRDSSADPPKSKQDPPPLDTLHIKVVEHLSRDAYDKKAKIFSLGHEDNKPIAGMKFKIKMPDGSIAEKVTDENGIIELTGQDPHGRFELIHESQEASLNNMKFLYSKAITPLKTEL
jgi:uncharacterized Zn-binding protein involved in type VI secretion